MAITLNGTTITMNDSSTIVSTTTYGAIGSYAMWYNRSSSISIGATVAGSSLTSTTDSSGAGVNLLNQDGGFMTNKSIFSHNNVAGSGQHANLPGYASGSGTWRSMFHLTIAGNSHSVNPESGAQGNAFTAGFFARIS